MKSSIMLALGAVAVAFVGFAAAPAEAQDAMKIVQDRQAAMKEQGKELGAVKAFIDGKGDLAAAQTGADGLVKSIPQIPNLVPAEDGHGRVPRKIRRQAGDLDRMGQIPGCRQERVRKGAGACDRGQGWRQGGNRGGVWRHGQGWVWRLPYPVSRKNLIRIGGRG